MALWSLLSGSSNDAAKKYNDKLARVNELETEIKNLSSDSFKKETEQFKIKLEKNEATLDDILPRAFALAREASSRVLKQRHYDSQIIGGIVLHEGKIAEMRTGEGKTLAATLPVYLNALRGGGVHIVTVNDYLAKRDGVWMGQIYYALGLSVGVIAHDRAYIYDPSHIIEEGGLSENEADKKRDELGGFHIEQSYLRPVSRKEAYRADITYGTNNEFGFDYLRDNLVQSYEDKTQRGFSYAIVDEVDSILIDEARTPLIISAPDTESSNLYSIFARIAPGLKRDEDYSVDEKLRSVALTEAGIEKVEKSLNIDNLYDLSSGGGTRHVHALEQALKAKALFERDKDYVVKNGEVIIVDEFTGRMMPGRRFSEGLHQALEAKEGVAIKRESRTVATITFQNYFRMYEKLAGMTGTAKTNEEEFLQVYRLDVIIIPTNKPIARKDYADLVFMTENGKYKALIEEIKDRNEDGQPILVGTTSIESNERLSALLKKEGIKHELLNAKNHEREGEIIAQAGKKSAVTVATNMAGRGVDIILGGNPPDKVKAQEIKEAGGLHIIGTERHDARRIDDQLRGRAGRQGDPGSGQFFLSLEDKMVRVFGGDRIQKLMSTLRMPEDQPIESKMVSGAIEGAQKKIEGMNFDTRKHLLEYDQVLNRQRSFMYKKRDEILKADNEKIYELSREYIQQYIDSVLLTHCSQEGVYAWDIDKIAASLALITSKRESEAKRNIEQIIEKEQEAEKSRSEISEYIYSEVDQMVKAKKEELGAQDFATAIRLFILRTLDTLWMEHLEAMEYMRDAVRLRAYGQRDPLAEYKNEGSRMFEELEQTISHTVAASISKLAIVRTRPSEGARQNINRALNQGDKVGRNDQCPCGSGKKYKKCCGK